jgi:riboflavin synthase
LFTGIIEQTGRIAGRRRRGAGARLTIRTGRPLALVLGESVSVNGACLTVTGRNGRSFDVDVSPETLRRTTLGALSSGTRVNLERALRVGDRLGGHIVQGHVDGVGRLEAIRPEGDWLLYRFRLPRALAAYLVEKGSIAIDGVSLTVFACRRATFTVALVPHTLAHSTLGERRPGDRVNVEADVLLKHIAAMVGSRRRGGRRSTSARGAIGALQSARPPGKLRRRWPRRRRSAWGTA